MPANIDRPVHAASSEAAAFMSDREPAWHRLGVHNVGAVTIPEAMKIAHLDGWDVTTSPIFTADHTGAPIRVPGKAATIRRNPWFPGVDEDPTNVLGVVSSSYPVIQNETAFDFLSTIVDDADATVSTAGAYDHGRKAFMSLLLPDTMKVAGEDPVDLYLTGITSHDGSMAWTTIATPIRVVCQNTATYALANANTKYRVVHSGDVTAKVAEAREALALTFAYAEAWVAKMDALVTQTMTEAMFDRFARDLLGRPADDAPAAVLTRVETKIGDLHYLFAEAETNEFGRGTKYAALNAVGEWAEWVAPKYADASAKSALFGPAADIRQKAHDLLTAR